MTRIIHFWQLRKNRLPISACWRMSGMRNIAKKAADIAAFFVVGLGCLYLMSEQANSASAAADNKGAATIRQQQEVIAGMSKIIDACLSDATGRPVTINGRVFLCGIVDTGVSQ